MAEKRLVLLIEDDPAVQRVTCRILETFGFEVDSAEDIPGALVLLKSRVEETACILLDYSLKGGTGGEALRKMRELDAELPVIVLSGYPQQDIEEQLGEEKPTGFLQKPYRPEELREMVELHRRR